jgi:hypothetical protein
MWLRHSRKPFEIFNVLNRLNFSVPSSAAMFDAAGNYVLANDIITSIQTHRDRRRSR